MKRLILVTVFYLLIHNTLQSQQLPSWSSYYEVGFIWNPALTAKWNTMETSITHRRDWMGFDDSPETSTISVQLPFISATHTRSAVGAYLEQDKVGPYRKLELAFSYAYGFSPSFLGKYDDVLSLGIKANFGQYSYDPSSLIFFDQSRLGIDLPEVAGDKSISPNLGLGIFYNSVSDFYQYEKSHYYAGISLNHIVPLKSTELKYQTGDFGALGNITNKPHVSVHLGYRVIPYKFRWKRGSVFFYEPNLMLIYGFSKAIHVMGNMRFESVDKYWASAGAATSGEIYLQAGLIFDKHSFLSALVREGALRLGVKMDYHLGNFGRYAGIGYEFYGAYVWSVE
ncbi:MAG: PorP/SprF family type IX secretion system membrane protein [Saprospiraceae bacterium]|nr:PorP/SprF family type IX secretion system membrane protein [Saprospiraceae bacterium]